MRRQEGLPVLMLFPWLAWIAIVTSASLLAILHATGDIENRALVFLAAWLLVAGYLQFLAASLLATTAGLLFQTALAVYLLIRWKASRA